MAASMIRCRISTRSLSFLSVIPMSKVYSANILNTVHYL
jgi:hypothetical protein